MIIPFIISIDDRKQAYLDKDLFGVGEKSDIDTSQLRGYDGGPLYKINNSITIQDGISIGLSKKQNKIYAKESFVPTEILTDFNYYLELTDTLLSIAGGLKITDWVWNKIRNHNCSLKLNGKEIKTKDEFQKSLDEYIKSNKND